MYVFSEILIRSVWFKQFCLAVYDRGSLCWIYGPSFLWFFLCTHSFHSITFWRLHYPLSCIIIFAHDQRGTLVQLHVKPKSSKPQNIWKSHPGTWWIWSPLTLSSHQSDSHHCGFLIQRFWSSVESIAGCGGTYSLYSQASTSWPSRETLAVCIQTL